jgi:hypothetical protein
VMLSWPPPASVMATACARLVLPTPPGPVSVTHRTPELVSREVTFEISRLAHTAVLGASRPNAPSVTFADGARPETEPWAAARSASAAESVSPSPSIRSCSVSLAWMTNQLPLEVTDPPHAETGPFRERLLRQPRPQRGSAAEASQRSLEPVTEEAGSSSMAPSCPAGSCPMLHPTSPRHNGHTWLITWVKRVAARPRQDQHQSRPRDRGPVPVQGCKPTDGNDRIRAGRSISRPVCRDFWPACHQGRRFHGHRDPYPVPTS